MEQCDKECYTKGKGCKLSQDGRCLHIFKDDKTMKFSMRDYFKPKKDGTKSKN